ncbi:MAG: RIP metalloprotease RseP [Gammaproteobacteria bacterium]|nr:RIP metalloprotease RseP [Gammaproteobacteria bacterium]
MQSLLFLIVTLAILIVVHEFGHFWVARRCGVKVLKFSVGFGKPLWSRFGRDGTEYIVTAIPLGGYVKMLDEREGEVAEEDLDKAFNRKPLGSRVAIVAAGPIANLLFAVLAYWFIFVLGIPGLRPVIGDIKPNSPAAYAQLVSGDEIKAVNGRDTLTWSSTYKALARVAETGGVADIIVNAGGSNIHRQLNIDKYDFSSTTSVSLLQHIGLTPIRVPFTPIIGTVVQGKAAEKSGLIVGDLIVAVDEQPIQNWLQFVERVQASPNKLLTVTVERNGQNKRLLLTPLPENNVGKIGAGVDSSKTEVAAELQTVERYGWGEAVGKAFYETWAFSVSTLKSLAGMVTGEVSSKNIGGPITIAQYASASADRGLISFISFLAMVSISLGLLNLLPIPILDGGHLFLYLVEWLRGAPLSEEVQFQSQKVGIILLLMLMFLAFFNDLTRLFG